GLSPSARRGPSGRRDRPAQLGRTPADPQIRTDRAAAAEPPVWRVGGGTDVGSPPGLRVARADLRTGGPAVGLLALRAGPLRRGVSRRRSRPQHLLVSSDP